MGETEIALLGRIVAIERLLIGLMAERAGMFDDPTGYIAGVKNAVFSSAQNAQWDTGGEPAQADQVAAAAADALKYLFHQIQERVRQSRTDLG